MHGGLAEITRGRADDSANYQAPPFHTGADGSRVTVYEIRTPNGQTAAQLVTNHAAGGEAIARELRAVLDETEWAEL